MSSKSRSADGSEPFWIAYDGECPFCSVYVRLTRLRASAGPLELIDARSGHPALDEIRQAGLDINQGMVVRHQGRLYHGADAMHVMSLLSTRSSFFNGIMALMFTNERVARVLYPVLRAGRNLTLRLMGRKLIDWQTGADLSDCETRSRLG
jgi:predicted DCC family thiol-disulfide oxidoreductase YuxK